MAELQMVGVQLPRVKLGNQGLEVSKLGFGCRGLSGGYNNPVPGDVGIAIIKHAFSKGITFFDTADAYGAQANEVLIGKVSKLGFGCAGLFGYAFSKGITFFDTSDFYGPNAELLVGKVLKELPREKIQLATKFGLVRAEPTHIVATLKHLDVGYIDLYYQHRIDTSVPIEETAKWGSLRSWLKRERFKYIGLCEASSDTIRRAHVVHPITAIEMEWSLWTREIEEEILPLCRELGIGIVPYSPLGRGFFGGKAAGENLPANSFLRSNPRFQGENFEKNKLLYAKIEMLAEKHRCTPAQLALAWLFHQGIMWCLYRCVKISRTTKIKNIDNNIGSLRLKFTQEELEEISAAVTPEEVAGARVADNLIRCSWRFANTPARETKSSNL
ncbi:hypothetical protein AAG906_022120 [Vitis piasezkii]